jgi:KaiC/GvpD/RAD55 family RecA-like ATPase
VKSEQFNPTSVLQELQEHQRSLYDERERRRQVEEQLEQVKRGSVAVIKYVRSREEKARQELLEEKDAEITELKGRLDQLVARVTASQEGKVGPSGAEVENARTEFENRLQMELAGREAQFAEREGELKRRVAELDGELRTIRMQAEATKTASSGGPVKTDAALKAQDERESEIIRRENELRTRFEEIRIRAEEIERKREAIQFKEREFSGREQDIELRQRALEVEGRRIEEAKKTLPAAALAGNPAALAEQNRLDSIEDSLQRRERELMEREAFLTSKLAEAQDLQDKAVAVEADRLRVEAVADAKSGRLRTGVRRLDDLLFGGLPPGSQVLLNGPAHTGKDILARLFVVEALKTGQGALWVITDRTYTTVREEMVQLYPPYAELEKRGFVRYVDLYSRSLGVTEAERGVKLLASNDKALLEQLTAAVNSFASELKERAPSYRMVFESVSTVTAYLDSTASFRFLQPMIGRRKLDGACAYYELETGMHSESDLQTLEHMMDGSIHLKVDQLKTFLSIRGITDVQSRAWVGYNFSKKAFTLGSFSLDHIR